MKSSYCINKVYLKYIIAPLYLLITSCSVTVNRSGNDDNVTSSTNSNQTLVITAASGSGNFGSVNVGDLPYQTIYVENNGTVTAGMLEALTVTLSGTNATEFAIADNTCTTVLGKRVVLKSITME
jgi:hypothetical protein